MSRHLFITGATGFLGRRLLARLEGGAMTLTCLHRGAPGGGRARWLAGDLRKPSSYARGLEGADTVVHLAAATGAAPAAEHAAVNAEGTHALLRCAREAGVQRVLVTSTIAVSFPDRSGYPYALSKEEAERAVSGSGLAFVIVRPTIILGPGAPVLAGLRRLATLPVVPAFGRRDARVQPIDVEDLAGLLETLLEPDLFQGQTEEVGGPTILTMTGLLQAIRRLVRGRPGRVVRVPLAPLRALLRLAGAAGLRLPLTPGQLSSFVHDGVARPSELMAGRQATLTPLDRTLRRSLAAEAAA